MHNTASTTYSDVVVCGTLHSADGELQEVGSSLLYPEIVAPGEKRTIPIFFNSMPKGVLKFYAYGKRGGCCDAYALPPNAFEPSASKVVDYAGTRYLLSIGELTNARSQVLTGVQIAAHSSDSWLDRAREPYRTPVCSGALPANGSSAALLQIPLTTGRDDVDPLITAISARPQEAATFPLAPESVTIGPVVSTLDGQLEEREVSATIRNTTSTWIDVLGICLILRDADGAVVGFRNTFIYGGRYLAPGWFNVARDSVVQLRPSQTAEVVAYGIALPDGPPKISPP